ncbi:MAG: UDP-2,3-diacylglucosamine pyrophosphatase [uncultured Craurococcus sp.]|uniref:UDP-2,3-diacylglucosamine pyrophosphatase n=1 Tax=uncultured Craurococcus sp. TaxID=1135998 RepID=A0A6J4HKE9_9PROT|nr:MAG: UDP-2,3-diacylglucosamine pyrophosphatase [uncultured Craurococcus sp.]
MGTASDGQAMSPDQGPLGLIAGGGQMPLRVIAAAQAAGRQVFAVVVEGWADPADFRHVPHIIVRVGAGGHAIEQFRAHGVRQIVMCGRAQRPSLMAIRPDVGMARMLLRVGIAAWQGDDGLLKAVVRILEEDGFEVVPSQAIVRDILPEPGLLGAAAPQALARGDIRRGIAVVRALGAVDVGQCAVVQQGLVLGVEAIEGTDALLARCAGLRREGPGGVLVKLVKPGQDRRVDLPTIGPVTVAGAAAAGLVGIAIEARGTIVVDRPATVAAADAAGLFLLALDPDEFLKETTP